MSNFLSNLVTRSFGTATGIRPRVASQFEPAARLPGAFLDPGEGDSSRQSIAAQGDEVETGRPGEDPAMNLSETLEKPHKTARRISFQLAASALAGDSSSPEAAAESERRSTLGRIQQGPKPALADDGAVRSEERRSLVAGSISPKTPAAPAVAPMDDKIRMEEERAAPRLKPTILDGQMPGRKLARIIARPLSATDVTRDALSNNLLNHRVASRLGITPAGVRAKRQSSLNHEVQESGAEPSIHVTIGRVEVRAELASSATGRADRKPSPVMSLEEYLRRRSKRGAE